MIPGFEKVNEQLAALTVRGDLISRQAAIDAVVGLPNCYNGYSDTYDKACIIGVLEELPTAEPEPQWIPVTERLPEKDGNYLIWFQYKNALGNLSESMAMEYYADSTGWDCDNVEVIAWHPLPDPYKGAKMEPAEPEQKGGLITEQGIDRYGAEYKRTGNDFHAKYLEQDNCVCTICHGTGAKLEIRYIVRNYESARVKKKICKNLQAHERSLWICPKCINNFKQKLSVINERRCYEIY